MPTRILLADDHLIVREGLKALLEGEGFAIVAEVGDGHEAVRVARERCPDVAVVDFGMPLLNGFDAARAINEVQKGMVYLSPGISQTVVQAYLTKSDVPPDPLTPREREVLQLVAEGKTTKEVAKLLGISVKTAESHRTRIMEKLEIHETASLVRYAVRRGLIQP